MINLISVNSHDCLSYQKSYVGYEFISNAFKYALIPITNELKSVCRLIPQIGLEESCCILSHAVIQYPNYSSLRKIVHNTTLNTTVKRNDIRVLNTVIDAKILEVSVVFYNSLDVQKWKSRDELPRMLNEILCLFVVVSSSLVLIPSSKINQADIVYICIHNTNSKRTAYRITQNTEIIIKEMLSLSKFEQLCTVGDSFKTVGLENQISFLDLVYNAHLTAKSSQLPIETKFVQKILLIGPPGSGKTRLIKHFVEEKKCGMVVIEGASLSNAVPGESERILRSLFDEAYQRSREGNDDLCLVVVDQIENICRNSRSTASHVKRISYQLFHILETLDEYPGIIFVAITNDVHALDPAVRRATRLEVEMYIGTPTEKEREEMLQLFSSGTKIKSAVCKKVAACTPGYVGADLALLVREVDRILRVKSESYRTEQKIFLLFKDCLTKHPASSLRGGLGVARFRNVQMDNLGGLSNVKLYLKSFIEWPLKYPMSFKKLGIPTPKGILLYGPPGCAKTSLACAVANATNTNFLTVSAAELYSPYVGEAERNVIDLFHKARINSPCIVFIDEIDALVGNRNVSSKNVQCKILSTFLTEMDGFGNKLDVSGIDKVITNRGEMKPIDDGNFNTVIIIAATNRPDKLDSALIRPGRFDKLMYVGPPDLNDRLDILQTILKEWKMPTANCVDLLEIAKVTDGFTGADLTNLMKEAGYVTLFEDMAANCVRQEHIVHALKFVKSSLSDGNANAYQGL